MPKLLSLAAVTAASVALVAAAPSVAAPVTVNLRVEGSSKTFFEGPITTDAKTLTKDSSGSHPCDGTNGGANPTPGPTMTSALDDGLLAAGVPWTATWYDSPGDFFVDSIGSDFNEPSPPFTYWGYFYNGVSSNVGGCQQQVHPGDNVLYTYSVYGQHLLELSAPARAATGEAVQVTVQDNDGAGNRVPAVGASVAGATTDAAGHASVSFADTGQHTFKATRSDSVRSNAATVCVYAPGSGDCGTDKPSTGTQAPANQPAPQPQPAVKDTTPPVIHVGSPTSGKTYASGPRLLSGDIDEAGGIAQVFLRVRATDGGNLTAKSQCRWFSGKRGVFTHRTVPCERARFFRVGTNPKFSYLLPSRLGKGKYVLDVKVLDRAYNAGRASIPFKVK
jgi:hypothetical protein